MIIPTTGTIVPWRPGHLRSPYSPNDFLCRCNGCKKTGIYGESNICKWTINVLENGKIRLEKTASEWIYCSGCTMPMQIRPARDLSEPAFYDFDTIDDVFDHIYDLIDVQNLHFYWNNYYECNNNADDFEDHLRDYLRREIREKNDKVSRF